MTTWSLKKVGFILKFVYFYFSPELEVCLQINTIPIESLTFHGTRAVHELCRIFENPSTTAKKVIIYMPETPEQVFSTLISEFETREVKIKGKEIMFRKNAENSSWAAQILALFKEGYLEKIYVDCVTGAIFEKLVELEQFKMCKYIKLEARVLSEQQLLKFDSSFKVNYDFLQHAERLELSLCDLEPEDAWEIIKVKTGDHSNHSIKFLNIFRISARDHNFLLTRFSKFSWIIM